MSLLELALVDLGGHLRYPEAEDMTEGVVGRLESQAKPATPRRMVVLVAATLAVMVGGLALLSPAVRAALVRVLLLPGVRIEIGGPTPEAPVQRLGEGLELGDPTTLAEAREEAGFPVRIPAELGPPDRVFVEPSARGRRVWLVYRARPGLPAAEETGVGLLVAEFQGSVDDLLLKKVEAEGGTVMPVEVEGDRGFFLRDAHALMFLDESGNPVDDRTRVAGNVLVWAAEGVVYRFESDLDLAENLRLAESLG
jgi:hypothetical protein